MNAPKLLTDYAAVHNLLIVPIRYRHQFGYCKRKGFDICNKAGHILISLEPCNFLGGDRWFIRHKHYGYNGPDYIKRISSGFLSTINPAASSFIRNSVVTVH